MSTVSPQPNVLGPEQRQSIIGSIDQAALDPVAIAVVGSTATGRDLDPLSDLDVLVVVETPDFYRSVCGSADDQVIDMCVVGRDRLVEVIARGRTTGAPIQAQMLATAVALHDPYGIVADLRGVAIEMLEDGPDYPEETCLLFAEATWELAQDLKKATLSPQERTILSLDLARTLCDFLCIADGQWRGRGKWLARSLQLVEGINDGQATIAMLAGALAEALEDRVQRLIEVAESCVRAYGGAPLPPYRVQL